MIDWQISAFLICKCIFQKSLQGQNPRSLEYKLVCTMRKRVFNSDNISNVVRIFGWSLKTKERAGDEDRKSSPVPSFSTDTGQFPCQTPRHRARIKPESITRLNTSKWAIICTSKWSSKNFQKAVSVLAQLAVCLASSFYSHRNACGASSTSSQTFTTILSAIFRSETLLMVPTMCYRR